MVRPIGRVTRPGVALHRGCSALLPLLLAGCISVPDIGPTPVPAVPVALEIATASQPALTQDAVPAQWWALFGDARLEALQREAAGANLDLQAAMVRIEESRARLGLVRADRRPQIGATAAYTRSGLSENAPLAKLGASTDAIDLWRLGLQAGWELDLWGRLRHLDHAAQARLQATGYQADAMKVSVAGDVARTYLLLRGVQAQEAILIENRQIAGNLVSVAESRERNGVATRFDAAAARADLAGVEASLSQVRQQRDALINALAFLLGRAPRELNETLADGAMPAMPQRLPLGLPSGLARQRPDILQAEANLRAAVADIGAAKADFYPRISLTGSIGVEALDAQDLNHWRSRAFSVGPALHLPIFQGGRLKANLELSQARHRLAGIAYQRVVLQAWREVDDALRSYASERERHRQLQTAFDENTTALQVAQRSYQQGRTDFSSVLLARRSLLASQSELADCATASALSVVSLYRALGGAWSPALKAVPEGAGA